MRITNLIATAAVGIAATLTVSVPAQADPAHNWLGGIEESRDGSVSVGIDISDIDVVSASGSAELQSRLRIAARAVCSHPLPGSMVRNGVRSATRSCREATYEAARPLVRILAVRSQAGETFASLRLGRIGA